MIELITCSELDPRTHLFNRCRLRIERLIHHWSLGQINGAKAIRRRCGSIPWYATEEVSFALRREPNLTRKLSR